MLYIVQTNLHGAAVDMKKFSGSPARRAKAIIVLILILPAMLIFPGLSAGAATPFRDLVATAALLAEADSGAVLFERNIDRRHPADSLAKIMTLLLAATACTEYVADQGAYVEMTESAWEGIGANSTTLGIQPGEEMPLIDLMYCAYIGGAAEACNLIAEYISGSVESFVEAMNARAISIGCRNTNFANTHGQYSTRQYTTASDMFYIFREAISNPLFTEINASYRYTVESTNMSESRNLISSNSLLNANGKYYYAPCTSGLASATFEGGYSFVAFAEAGELSLISVVLGSDIIETEDESYQMRNLTESRRLFEWGFAEFGWRTILSSGDLIAKAPVQDGDGADFVNLHPESSIVLLIDNDIPLEQFKKNIIIYSVENDEPLIAPVSAGDVLGEVTLTRDGVTYGPVLLVANTDVGLNRLVFIKIQLMDVITGKTARIVLGSLAALVAIYVALVIRYNVIKYRRKRRIRAAKRKLAEERRTGYREPPD